MFNNKRESTQEQSELTQPFKVFYTEREWREAVAEEIEKIRKMSGGAGEAEEREYGEKINSTKQRLLREATELKEKVPEFDLMQALREDSEFRERIMKGYSLEEAFYLSNRKKSAEVPPKKKIGMRENGRGNYMGTGVNRNIASMSDAEFKKYINSIKGSRL